MGNTGKATNFYSNFGGFKPCPWFVPKCQSAMLGNYSDLR